MKDIGIKLTIYDFLGYFIPGMLLIFIVCLNKCYLDNFSFNNHDIKLMVDELSLNTIILGILMSYLLGFFLNALGALFFEMFLFRRIKSISKKLDPFELLPSLTIERFKIRFKEVYGKDYEDKDRQGIIALVAENKPQIYGRAFFFLVIYGFSRTIMTVLLINNLYLFYYLFSTNWAWIEFCFSLIILLIFTFNYIKFKQYFEKESIYGFILH